MTDLDAGKRKVLVCGGRDFSDMKKLMANLDRLHRDQKFCCLIHGNARGADTFAAQWAYMNDVRTKEFPADWTRYGKAAGPIRNKEMLEDGRPDLVVAFRGGKGTQNMIEQAKRKGVEVIQIP